MQPHAIFSCSRLMNCSHDDEGHTHTFLARDCDHVASDEDLYDL